MQCQFGIFLKDSLTFLLGDLKKIKVYNIFRLLFFLVPPKRTTRCDLPGWRSAMFSSLLSWEMGGVGG